MSYYKKYIKYKEKYLQLKYGGGSGIQEKLAELKRKQREKQEQQTETISKTNQPKKRRDDISTTLTQIVTQEDLSFNLDNIANDIEISPKDFNNNYKENSKKTVRELKKEGCSDPSYTYMQEDINEETKNNWLNLFQTIKNKITKDTSIVIILGMTYEQLNTNIKDVINKRNKFVEGVSEEYGKREKLKIKETNNYVYLYISANYEWGRDNKDIDIQKYKDKIKKLNENLIEELEKKESLIYESIYIEEPFPLALYNKNIPNQNIKKLIDFIISISKNNNIILYNMMCPSCFPTLRLLTTVQNITYIPGREDYYHDDILCNAVKYLIEPNN